MNRPNAVALCLALAPLLHGTAAAQEPDTSLITISGFISATAFVQDQAFAFSNGQAAEWAASLENTTDAWFLGGDIRNTRLAATINPRTAVQGWDVGGRIEFDLFGGFAGDGPFSDEQPHLRLRLAYIDLTKGRTTLRIGQAWTPLFGNVPVSITHLAFPLGYGSAGVIGWRYPGIFLYHTLTQPDNPLTARASVAAFRGSWNDPGNNLENMGPGEAALIPQLEARLDVSGSMGEIPWSAYAVAHVDRKDLSGVGRVFTAPEEDELTGTAFELGAKVVPGPLTLHGNVYLGESIGQQFGHITQFGDISGMGGWVQGGYALSPRLSAWLFLGIDDPDDDDVLRSGNRRLQNVSFAPSVRYSLGRFAMGAEWYSATTEWFLDGQEQTRNANELSFSVFLPF